MPRVKLVGRRYVADRIEIATGTRPGRRVLTSALEWMDYNIGTYYSENERLLYGITERLYRKEDVDIVVEQMVATDRFKTRLAPNLDVNTTKE